MESPSRVIPQRCEGNSRHTAVLRKGTNLMSEQDARPNSENIAEMRKNAKEGKDALERNANLERETAFLRAGFDTNDGGVKLAMRGYDGALDGDAIDAAIGSFGLQRLSGPTPASESGEEGTEKVVEEPVVEPTAVDAAELLSSGTQTDNFDPTTAFDKALELAQKERQEGGTEKESIAVGIASLRKSVGDGDQGPVLSDDGRRR